MFKSLSFQGLNKAPSFKKLLRSQHSPRLIKVLVIYILHLFAIQTITNWLFQFFYKKIKMRLFRLCQNKSSLILGYRLSEIIKYLAPPTLPSLIILPLNDFASLFIGLGYQDVLANLVRTTKKKKVVLLLHQSYRSLILEQ